MGGGGIARRGEQRRVGLGIVVGGEGEEAREGVVGHEGELEGGVTTGSSGDARGDVARDGGLTAQRDVETQVQVVIDARA